MMATVQVPCERALVDREQGPVPLHVGGGVRLRTLAQEVVVIADARTVLNSTSSTLTAARLRKALTGSGPLGRGEGAGAAFSRSEISPTPRRPPDSAIVRTWRVWRLPPALWGSRQRGSFGHGVRASLPSGARLGHCARGLVCHERRAHGPGAGRLWSANPGNLEARSARAGARPRAGGD